MKKKNRRGKKSKMSVSWELTMTGFTSSVNLPMYFLYVPTDVNSVTQLLIYHTYHTVF